MLLDLSHMQETPQTPPTEAGSRQRRLHLRSPRAPESSAISPHHAEHVRLECHLDAETERNEDRQFSYL